MVRLFGVCVFDIMSCCICAPILATGKGKKCHKNADLLGLVLHHSYQEVCRDLPLPGRMANFAAGVICLHMFSIVTLKITWNSREHLLFSPRIRPTLQIRNYQKKEQFLAIRMMPRRSQKINFSPVKTFSNYHNQLIFPINFLWDILWC